MPVCFSCLFRLLFALIVSCLAAPCFANPFTITQVQPIDFTVIPNLNGRCKMHFNGMLKGICFGTGQVGIYQINGTPNSQVMLSVSEADSVQPGLVFTPQLKKEFLSLDRRGRGKAKVAGTLDLNNTQSGLVIFYYYLTVHYD